MDMDGGFLWKLLTSFFAYISRLFWVTPTFICVN